MLPNAYFLAKFRFDTAENDPAKKSKILKFAIILQNLLILLTARPEVARRGKDLPAEVVAVVRSFLDAGRGAPRVFALSPAVSVPLFFTRPPLRILQEDLGDGFARLLRYAALRCAALCSVTL